MKIATVCALGLIVAASADLSPSNEAKKTSGDLQNEVNTSGDMHTEVDTLLDSAQLAFAHAEERRLRNRLRGKDSKQMSIKVSAEELAYQDNFQDMIRKLRKITSTCHGQKEKLDDNLQHTHGDLHKAQELVSDLHNQLKRAQRDLLEAQGQKSSLQEQLKGSLEREKSAHTRFEELQAMHKTLSDKLVADNLTINNLTTVNAEQVQSIQQLKLVANKTNHMEQYNNNLTNENAEQMKSIQQLKLTVNETSHALNVSHANEAHMKQQMESCSHLLEQYTEDNKIEHTNRMRAEQNVSKLLTDVHGLEIKLKGAGSNSTFLHSELVAEREKGRKDQAAKQTCTKDLEFTNKQLSALKKERDSATGALADAKSAAHTQLLAGQKKTQEALAKLAAEQKNSQEAMQQMKVTYENEIARLKAESEKGWVSSLMR